MPDRLLQEAGSILTNHNQLRMEMQGEENNVRRTNAEEANFVRTGRKGRKGALFRQSVRVGETRSHLRDAGSDGVIAWTCRRVDGKLRGVGFER
jgi:hypothetical protein